MSLAQQKMALEREKMQLEASYKQQDLNLRKAIADAELRQTGAKVEGEFQIGMAKIQSDEKGIEVSLPENAGETIAQMGANVDQALEGMGQVAARLSEVAMAMAGAVKDMNAPKEIVRDSKGRPSGVRVAR